jgi:hypothetical protein
MKDSGKFSNAEDAEHSLDNSNIGVQSHTSPLNTVYAKAVGEQLAEDWDKEMAKELGVSRDVTKDAAAHIPAEKIVQEVTPTSSPTTPAYFTDGEMLPWKGRWFRVKLLQLPDGQKVIGLDQVKATASSTKRAERELRWKRQHPHAVAPRPGSRLPFTPLASSRVSG